MGHKEIQQKQNNVCQHICRNDKRIKYFVKAFEKSPFHTGYLKNILKIMELRTLHILNRASTRMCNLLTACQQITEILVPFIETITHLEIKKETANKLLAPEHLTCILILGVGFIGSEKRLG